MMNPLEMNQKKLRPANRFNNQRFWRTVLFIILTALTLSLLFQTGEKPPVIDLATLAQKMTAVVKRIIAAMITRLIMVRCLESMVNAN